jgi:hypothetical protein
MSTAIRVTFTLFLLVAMASPAPVMGQAASDPGSLPLDDMQFRLIGPYRGGRSIAAVGHPTERLTFYFGSTGGGVWKTLDAGHSWVNVSDGYFKTGSVGALNTRFVGTLLMATAFIVRTTAARPGDIWVWRIHARYPIS